MTKIDIDDKSYEVKICNSFKDRLIGLMFKRDITKCYFFPNCNSIHTFFMFKNIDIIMTDKNNKIIFLKKSLKPWRIVLPKKNATNIFELPEHSIKALNINDQIQDLYSNS